jgi:hypothetical protein
MEYWIQKALAQHSKLCGTTGQWQARATTELLAPCSSVATCQRASMLPATIRVRMHGYALWARAKCKASWQTSKQLSKEINSSETDTQITTMLSAAAVEQTPASLQHGAMHRACRMCRLQCSYLGSTKTRERRSKYDKTDRKEALQLWARVPGNSKQLQVQIRTLCANQQMVPQQQIHKQPCVVQLLGVQQTAKRTQVHRHTACSTDRGCRLQPPTKHSKSYQDCQQSIRRHQCVLCSSELSHC